MAAKIPEGRIPQGYSGLKDIEVPKGRVKKLKEGFEKIQNILTGSGWITHKEKTLNSITKQLHKLVNLLDKTTGAAKKAEQIRERTIGGSKSAEAAVNVLTRADDMKHSLRNIKRSFNSEIGKLDQNVTRAEEEEYAILKKLDKSLNKKELNKIEKELNALNSTFKKIEENALKLNEFAEDFGEEQPAPSAATKPKEKEGPSGYEEFPASQKPRKQEVPKKQPIHKEVTDVTHRDVVKTIHLPLKPPVRDAFLGSPADKAAAQKKAEEEEQEEELARDQGISFEDIDPFSSSPAQDLAAKPQEEAQKEPSAPVAKPKEMTIGDDAAAKTAKLEAEDAAYEVDTAKRSRDLGNFIDTYSKEKSAQPKKSKPLDELPLSKPLAESPSRPSQAQAPAAQRQRPPPPNRQPPPIPGAEKAPLKEQPGPSAAAKAARKPPFKPNLEPIKEEEPAPQHPPVGPTPRDQLSKPENISKQKWEEFRKEKPL